MTTKLRLKSAAAKTEKGKIYDGYELISSLMGWMLVDLIESIHKVSHFEE